MALRDFLKGATEIGKAMGVTLRSLTETPVTTEYPRDPVPLYPRFRGKHELRRYEPPAFRSWKIFAFSS